MDISIVILNWNDKEHLRECLTSIERCSKSRETEIIVVDNASTDGSPEMVEEKFPRVKLIKHKENIGFPRGNNAGMEASLGKYIYLLNSDIKVLDDCIDQIAGFMDQNPQIGICGPKILNGDMTHQSSCRRFPSLWNNFCTAVGLSRFYKDSKFFSGEHMLYFSGEKTLEVDVLVGCFWAVRRKAMLEFGPLDDGFFMYAEDVDWCRRCWQSNWKVVFCPLAKAIHYRGSSSKQDPVRCAVTQQASVLRYWRKHHGPISCLAVGAIIFVHLLARFGGALLSYFARPSTRSESRARMVIARACLRALFSRSVAQPAGQENRKNAPKAACPL